MSQQPAAPAVVTWWRLIYGVILAGILLYVFAWAADTKFLTEQVALASVSGKEHRDMKQTYTVDKVGNITRVVPRVIPEQYILKLRIKDKEVEWPVKKDYYQIVEPGQQVRVRYEKRRITGSFQVVALEGE